MRHAALLKGVNVGGNRKLPMADLRAFLEGEGFGAVRTLLASGNAVFEAEAADEAALAAAAKAKLGLETEWLLRTHAELAAVIVANPFVAEAADHPGKLVVVFHRAPFPAALLAALAWPGPERLAAVGRELFIDFPDGQGESRLVPALAKARFPKVATGRNWNTVTKLAALTA